MRKLDFTTEDGAERFEVLYGGILGSTRGFEAPSETRVLSKVLDAMEGVGVATTDEGGTATFKLKDGGGIVLLEDAEYALMDSAISKTKWKAGAVRKVTKAIDWFKEAPTEAATDSAK